MDVEIYDPMEHLEDLYWKKSSCTCPSAFVPTGTSITITKLLDGILEYHSTVGRITVQDELDQLWEGGIILKKMEEAVVDQ